MVVAKKYVIINYFKGDPSPSDLKLEEEQLAPIKDGEYLVEAEYLSVDPYMRRYASRFPLGTVMIGSQVAKITESKDPDFPVGKRIIGYLGWRTHTIIDMKSLDKESMFAPPTLLPDFGDLPSSLALGVLGMPGNTAYFGFTEICKPKTGEVLVVSGAAGAVGSHVGQIGKILGLKVIGIAGSEDKCKWITKELGFDHAINYKTQDVDAELQKLAPDGVDCYFDNVGGQISSAVIYNMRLNGRISVCGSISAYNVDGKLDELPKCTVIQPRMIFQQLCMQGFMVFRWSDRWIEGIQKNLEWIQQGKLVYRETVVEGFDKMFDTFTGLFRGENTGKAVVKV